MTAADRYLIGGSSALRRVRELIRTVAPTRLPVLIHGETGTGKELVAAALHDDSRRKGMLVSFNVCAIADTMFEDSLFGHVRGAFTGATADSLGFLREADGGTAFFDEVSGLPGGLQAKLLRVIETGVLRPVGATRDCRSDFRVVAATNERLSDLVKVARFRADLAHRLSGVVIEIPPLRERAEDIPALVQFFAASFSPESPVKLETQAISVLMEREWAGNIRELRQVVESAIVLGGNVVDAESIGLALSSRQTMGNGTVVTEISPRGRLLAELQRSDWDTRVVAERLGVHRATVYRWMHRLHLEMPPMLFDRVEQRS